MKIVFEELPPNEEEVIIIRCREMTVEIYRAISLLKALETLIAYDGNNIYRVLPSDIYYIETVDNKTFLYCKDKIYESKQKLYELEEVLLNTDFLRVSKSAMLNLSKVNSLSPALNGRFEATLLNKEKIIISRQYVSDLKKKLGI